VCVCVVIHDKHFFLFFLFHPRDYYKLSLCVTFSDTFDNLCLIYASFEEHMPNGVYFINYSTIRYTRLEAFNDVRRILSAFVFFPTLSPYSINIRLVSFTSCTSLIKNRWYRSRLQFSGQCVARQPPKWNVLVKATHSVQLVGANSIQRVNDHVKSRFKILMLSQSVPRQANGSETIAITKQCPRVDLAKD